MTYFKFLCAMGVALLSLGCGGGDPGGPDDCLDEACANEAEAEAEAEAESEGQPTTGFLVATAQPALEGAVPFQLFVDGAMMVEVPTGGTEGRVEVPAGPHEVKIVCPGYGYAVAGYAWATGFQSTVSDWTMYDVLVGAGATTAINATVCRDLTGRWMREGGGAPDDITMVSRDGVCKSALPLFGLVVSGNTLTVDGEADGCTGASVRLLENGRRIEVDCGGANGTETDFIFVRVE